MPHTHCKAFHLKNKPPRRRFPKHNLLKMDSPPFETPYVAAAKASFSAHPHLDIRISMPSSCGGFNIDIPGAVVDSGAQVCLLQEQAIRDLPSRRHVATLPQCQSAWPMPTRSRSRPSSTAISALSNTSERLFHSGRIYIALGIRDCYISCDAMRNLRIIKHFPLLGLSNAPSCGLCVAAARTDKLT